jgi:hypothetical protein
MMTLDPIARQSSFLLRTVAMTVEKKLFQERSFFSDRAAFQAMMFFGG